MEIITKEFKVYTFDELSPDAKDKAREHFTSDFVFQHDWEKTLKKFCAIFPVDWKEYDYTCRQIYYNTRIPDEVVPMTGLRLAKYIHSHYYSDLFKPKYIEHLKNKVKFAPVYSKCQREASCVLTGCCYDEDILEPIYNFLKKPDANTNLEDLIKSCLYSWIKAMNDDYEYQISDEGVQGTCEANDYKFLENGKMF